MGKINGCLKCLFIFFNVLFVIIGCVLIFGAVKATALSAQVSGFGLPGLGWLWVFIIGVLCISCLGIYAGCAEKPLVLKIFAGFMGVGMVIMLICGIVVVVQRNKMRNAFIEATEQTIKPIMESNGGPALIESFQQTLHCCGISGPSDWGTEIPSSCECQRGGLSPFGGRDSCINRPAGTTGPDQVYAQSCGDSIFAWLDIFFKIGMGFFFAFAVTALMGLLISILMIYQIRRHDGAGGASIAMKGY